MCLDYKSSYMFQEMDRYRFKTIWTHIPDDVATQIASQIALCHIPLLRCHATFAQKQNRLSELNGLSLSLWGLRT